MASDFDSENQPTTLTVQQDASQHSAVSKADAPMPVSAQCVVCEIVTMPEEGQGEHLLS